HRPSKGVVALYHSPRFHLRPRCVGVDLFGHTLEHLPQCQGHRGCGLGGKCGTGSFQGVQPPGQQTRRVSVRLPELRGVRQSTTVVHIWEGLEEQRRVLGVAPQVPGSDIDVPQLRDVFLEGHGREQSFFGRSAEQLLQKESLAVSSSTRPTPIPAACVSSGKTFEASGSESVEVNGFVGLGYPALGAPETWADDLVVTHAQSIVRKIFRLFFSDFSTSPPPRTSLSSGKKWEKKKKKKPKNPASITSFSVAHRPTSKANGRLNQ